jgi:hypothetical protein
MEQNSIRFPRLVLVSAAVGNAPELVSRPIVGPRSNKEHLPWVAVAAGRVDGRLVLARRADHAPGQVPVLVDNATRALESTPCEWKVTDRRGFLWFKRPTRARAYGDLMVSPATHQTDGTGIDDYSSDLLLCATAMRAAVGVFGARALTAVVPKRGWLFVGPGQPGEIVRALLLLQLAAGVLERAGRDGISRMAFFLENGELTGIQDHAPSGEGYLSLLKPDSGAWQIG